jgi:DNA-binding transcriptional ArsR family regulator
MLFLKKVYIYIFVCIIVLLICKYMIIKGLNTEQLEKAANMLKAIAHPKRIAILSFLEEGKKLTVTQIHTLLNIEQSTTSHHLGILKDKGVLASKKKGKNTYYFIKHNTIHQIIECISKCTE